MEPPAEPAAAPPVDAGERVKQLEQQLAAVTAERDALRAIFTELRYLSRKALEVKR